MIWGIRALFTILRLGQWGLIFNSFSRSDWSLEYINYIPAGRPQVITVLIVCHLWWATFLFLEDLEGFDKFTPRQPFSVSIFRNSSCLLPLSPRNHSAYRGPAIPFICEQGDGSCCDVIYSSDTSNSWSFCLSYRDWHFSNDMEVVGRTVNQAYLIVQF